MVISSHRSPLTLGFLCPHNPHDRTAFSGTAFFAFQALQRQRDVQLHLLGGHRPTQMLDRLLRRGPQKARIDHLNMPKLDAVIGLVATDLLDDLNRKMPSIPFLHVTDATPAFLREAYGWGIPAATEEIEARVTANAAITAYSSGEMARRAPKDLGQPHLSAATVPFGINFETLPRICPQKPPLDRLNLLFVGLDWARKGGDIAVAALDQLLDQNQNAQLTVVGRCPERHAGHHAIRKVGFLNKAKSRDRAKLRKLYSEAHLLVLPSRGDCTPMVVAEAMAHGTPVLATDTGGIAEQIGRAGGQVLPQYSSPGQWAKAITQMTEDRDGYAMSSDAVFDRAHQVFNWDRWANEIIGLAQTACETTQQPRIAAAS